MNTGMLWYDDTPQRTLEDKMNRAAQRYREKHGRWPNTCYVHHAQVDGQEGAACAIPGSTATIKVRTAPHILLNHLWLGEEETNGKRGVGSQPGG